ncbi:sphingolipid delta(4)-desaturase DES1-like protein [Dinothrombium tinctorium]|uniref:sphingolipid 4-desaturase n=1 Tax=Dinothrombium tinctorium TaxID=1965070 RepID=A0A3S3S4P8_9ACAR|nr:sphingolipid delta(4)-desaturase DES1-like protein [Dinothrombium tinctorium]
MGAHVSRQDFEWVGSDEPHATRRKLILEKHPEIKSLMCVDPRFKWIVLTLVAVQLLTFIAVSHIDSKLILFLLAYCLTGVINHSLSLAVHEIAHGQAFGQSRVLANKLFGMIANLPIGLPMSVSFKKYHLEHHRYQGDDVIDTDIPSRFEAKVFTTTFTKLIWVILQPFFYSLRPLFVRPKPVTWFELLNAFVQLSFDLLIGVTLGWHVVVYMIFSTFIAMGLHPLAGHFISEHYIMFTKEEVRKRREDSQSQPCGDQISLIPETCSYYGPLNYLTFNVGYHVEHHDFPSIPGIRLPLVKKIAPEYYDNLCYHTSWVKVLYKYILDPNVGPYARVKRAHRGDEAKCKDN